MTILLGVNIDHVATIRQARRTDEPDPVAAAKAAFPIKSPAAPVPALTLTPVDAPPVTAIVVGFGRVGELVSNMLDVHGISHFITEKRPDLVTLGRKSGRPIYFGDALNRGFLERCGLANARAIILTLHDWDAMERIVGEVRAIRPDITIIARARDAGHAQKLYEIGVTDAVPETIEASLQLSEAVLIDLGIPAGPVIASIHEKRDEFRLALQKAAKSAGRTASRGLRSKVADRQKS